MKKLLLIPTLLAAMAITGCNKSDGKNPGSNPKDEVKERTVSFAFSDYFSGDNISYDTPVTNGVVTFNADIGDNTSNAPKYYDNYQPALRLYKGNTYSVTATKISKIVFELFIKDSDKQGYAMDVEEGVYNASTRTWEGNAVDTVHFSVPAAQKQTWIVSFTVTYVGKGGSGGEVDPGKEDELLYTIAKDIDDLLYGDEADYDSDIDYEDGEYFVYAISETNSMQSSVEYGKQFIPNYFELDTDTTEDTTDEDGYWYAIYTHKNFVSNRVVLQLGSYNGTDNQLIIEYWLYIY